MEPRGTARGRNGRTERGDEGRHGGGGRGTWLARILPGQSAAALRVPRRSGDDGALSPLPDPDDFTVPAPSGRPPRRRSGPRFTPVHLILAGLALVALYLWGFAADRYVSEAKFIVRSGMIATPDEDDMLSMVGGQTAADDTFAIHDFMLSRDMVDRLSGRMDLRAMFAEGGRDFIFSYPSLLNGTSREEFFEHFKLFVEVSYNTSTGISTVRAQGFNPEDSYRLAQALLEESEAFVNTLNDRSRRDAVEDAQAALEEARQNLITAQTELAVYRSRELVLDPGKSSIIVLELVGKLSAELARVNAEISNLRQSAGNSPQLPVLRQRALALQQQIMRERERTAASSDGLADKIAAFERLSVDHELAVKAMAAAFRSLALAKIQAERQQLYLQRVAGPHNPDHPTRPRRTTIFLASAILIGIGAMMLWVLASGLREHKAGAGGP